MCGNRTHLGRLRPTKGFEVPEAHQDLCIPAQDFNSGSYRITAVTRCPIVNRLHQFATILFDGDTFGKVTWLIDITATEYGDMVRK
jgi:hypothetical protein